MNSLIASFILIFIVGIIAGIVSVMIYNLIISIDELPEIETEQDEEETYLVDLFFKNEYHV